MAKKNLEFSIDNTTIDEVDEILRLMNKRDRTLINFWLDVRLDLMARARPPLPVEVLDGAAAPFTSIAITEGGE